MSDVLTFADASHLFEVFRATLGNRKVGRMIDGKVFVGEALCFADISGTASTPDVRDWHLRVLLPAGVEAYWPVRDLMNEVAEGYFVPEYQLPAG